MITSLEPCGLYKLLIFFMAITVTNSENYPDCYIWDFGRACIYWILVWSGSWKGKQPGGLGLLTNSTPQLAQELFQCTRSKGIPWCPWKYAVALPLMYKIDQQNFYKWSYNIFLVSSNSQISRGERVASAFGHSTTRHHLITWAINRIQDVKMKQWLEEDELRLAKTQY